METKKLLNPELQKAVDFFNGNQSKLANQLAEHTGKKVTQQHIWNWLYRDGRTPPEFAYPIEGLTQGGVKAYKLCPDANFPVPEEPDTEQEAA